MKNQPVSSQLDALAPAAAPEPPPAFLSAVRSRHRRRVAIRAGASFCILGLAVAIAMNIPAGTPPPQPRELVHTPSVQPLPITREPEVAAPATQIVRASFRDPDQIPDSPGAAQNEQSLRSGDRWDPEKVERWVLN